MRNRMLLLPLFLSLFAWEGCHEPASTSSWIDAGTLVHARSDHSATLLSDGAVLFAGGKSGTTTLASAEVRDTATNQWSLAPSMQDPRTQHASVRMGDGRVLLMGGSNGGALSSAEVFDPKTNEFSPAPPMLDARIHPTAIWMESLGKVIVIGGENASGALSSVEAYEPATNTWSTLANMNTPRKNHTATWIDEHEILVIGGADDAQELASAETYDTELNTWTEVYFGNDDATPEARQKHTTTRLTDGSILIVGGQRGVENGLSSSELYALDVATNLWVWSSVANMRHPRYGHTATLLNDRNVLIIGGEDANGQLDSAELFDASKKTFVGLEPLSSPRTEHTATWLANGSVLVVGGESSSALATAELFVPKDGRIPCPHASYCPAAMVCNADHYCEQSIGPLTAQSACSYSGNGAPSGAAPLFVAMAIAGLWSARRRHKLPKKHTAGAIAAGAMLLAPSLSFAQTPTFYLDRLQIAGGSEDGAGVWRPVFGQTSLFGQVAMGYAYHPLRVEAFVHDPEQASALSGSAVNLQLTAYATVGIALAKRGAIQVSLPYVVHQRGFPTDNRTAGLNQVVAMSSSTLGDMRIDGRMLVLWNDSKSFALAVRGAMFLPTGDEYSFTGEGTAWGNVGLSAEYNPGSFFVTANAGWTVRPKSSLTNLDVGSELVYAAGAYVPLKHDRLRLGAEFWGSVALVSSGESTVNPIEAALSGRMALGRQRRVFLGLSLGGRLGSGYAPDVRLVARLGGVIPFESTAERVQTAPVRVIPEADTDNDGLLDADDKCPQEREDFMREKDGCPELDGDDDGIPTLIDKCPLVAEDKDGLDDTDGCPEEDVDADGIADIDDKCPRDPGVQNEDATKRGCPQFIVRTQTEVKLFTQIEFETNLATIKPVSYPILDEIAKLLVANADIKQLRIEGHTDNVGVAASNQLLSMRRAEAVRDYLVQRGKVNASRLSFAGFGQTKPITPNDTAAGRAKNRRVELHIGDAAGGEEKKP